MSKAFDSVSLIGLEKALERIKVPGRFTKLMINLFKNRELSVITQFGPAKSFIAGDGIDQGEVISPLLWKIFYDPLLTEVQYNKTKSMGNAEHI